MISQKFAALGAGAVAVLMFASSASAQTSPPTATAPAAAPAPQLTHGAALPGICVFSRQRTLATSTVGKYVDTRVQQIVTQVSSELTAEKNAIDTEQKAIEAGRATMDQTALEKRAADLQIRYNAFQRKTQLRDREVDATLQKAVGRVDQEMGPVIAQIYQQRTCSMLLNADGSVMAANPAMDITTQVITGLNAKIQQFAFDREHLDQKPPAAKPAGQ